MLVEKMQLSFLYEGGDTGETTYLNLFSTVPSTGIYIVQCSMYYLSYGQQGL